MKLFLGLTKADLMRALVCRVESDKELVGASIEGHDTEGRLARYAAALEALEKL